jgi:hypothetical protein
LVENWPWALLFVLVIAPQLIIYAETGIYQRYLLPAALGMALAIMRLYRQIADNGPPSLRAIAAASLAFVLLFQLQSTVRASRSFAHEGMATTALLTTLIDGAKKETPILMVADPAGSYEVLYSLKVYMENEQKGSLYLNLYPRTDYNDYQKSILSNPLKWYDNRTLTDVVDKGLFKDVVIWNDLEQRFLRDARGWFDPSAYTRQSYPNLRNVVVYSR